MPLFLTESDVAGLLTMSDAMTAVESAFRDLAVGGDGIANVPRSRIFLPNGVLHHLSAALPRAGVLGTKTYTSFAGGTKFYVQLFSSKTGELLAYIEADKLGQMRTGAATGVAARYMALKTVETAAIVGAGWQAESQAEAIVAAQRKTKGGSIKQLRVFSRSEPKRTAFCTTMGERLKVECIPCATVEEAVSDAQIVVTATPSPAPIVKGEMLAPGTFVAAVGANRLTAREIDETVVARAAVTAVDDIAQAKIESAELIFAYERRKWDWSRATPLSEIITRRVPPRFSPNDVTLFKSLGIGLEDVAVAAVVYQKAVAAGIGRTL